MQLALTLTGPEPVHAPPAVEPGTYPCPCCGGRVVDEHTEGDALCCWCRDIDDPRLAERVRAARLRRGGPRRCCLARSQGRRREWTEAFLNDSAVNSGRG